jgi:Asp-tRNA(Asn)/Glu-tRNA(Gln) amidotransferase A subunit family amidase
MVPLALGNQTGGSTIRPAAFCGVVGCKPTFNLINRAGMKPLAESQDTVGLLARSVPDVALMLSILSGCAMPDLSRRPDGAPRVAVCSMADWPPLDDDMAAAMQDGAARLARAGARVSELELTGAFSDSLRAQRKVNDYEAWRALSHERLHHPDKLSSTLSARLAEAKRCTYEEYRRSQDVIADCRSRLQAMFVEYDVLVTPSVPGEAPQGLANTGDSSYNRIWTAFHTPSITLPVFHGKHGLPMGLQVIGPYREDAQTLSWAHWIHQTLTDGHAG